VLEEMQLAPLQNKIKDMDDFDLKMIVDDLLVLVNRTPWIDPLRAIYQRYLSAARNELFSRGLSAHSSSKIQERH